MVRMDLISKNNNETGEEYSAYLGCFFVVVRPPVFWLWEGSITHPGPAMVGLDRKAPKTKPGRIIAIGMVKWWLTFSSPDANRPARAFRPRMEGRGGQWSLNAGTRDSTGVIFTFVVGYRVCTTNFSCLGFFFSTTNTLRIGNSVLGPDQCL